MFFVVYFSSIDQAKFCILQTKKTIMIFSGPLMEITPRTAEIYHKCRISVDLELHVYQLCDKGFLALS